MNKSYFTKTEIIYNSTQCIYRIDWLITWLIDFNGMSTRLELFYA